MKSWKTTAGGVAALLVTLGQALTAITDDNPATQPNWEIVAVAACAAWTGMHSRDKNVSSEQQGVK